MTGLLPLRKSRFKKIFDNCIKETSQKLQNKISNPKNSLSFSFINPKKPQKITPNAALLSSPSFHQIYLTPIGERSKISNFKILNSFCTLIFLQPVNLTPFNSLSEIVELKKSTFRFFPLTSDPYIYSIHSSYLAGPFSLTFREITPSDLITLQKQGGRLSQNLISLTETTLMFFKIPNYNLYSN